MRGYVFTLEATFSALFMLAMIISITAYSGAGTDSGNVLCAETLGFLYDSGKLQDFPQDRETPEKCLETIFSKKNFALEFCGNGICSESSVPEGVDSVSCGMLIPEGSYATLYLWS